MISKRLIGNLGKILAFDTVGKRIVSGSFKQFLSENLIKTGIREISTKFFGAAFYALMIINIILFLKYYLLYLSNFPIITLIILSIFVFLISQLVLVKIFTLIARCYLSFRIYNRTRKIEQILPLFLQNVSLNMKAGMTFDKAIWNSVKPEMGVLADEVEIVAKKAFAGKNVEEALSEFSKKYESFALKRSIDLIILGMKQGSKITDIIDRIVENMNRNVILKKEMASAVGTYVTFITIMAILISPLMFSLSFQLLTVIDSLASKANVGGFSGGYLIPFSISEIPDEGKENFKTFSLLSVSIISLFSSIVIANIKKGSIKGGVFYTIVFVPSSILIYKFTMSFLATFFSNLF